MLAFCGALNGTCISHVHVRLEEGKWCGRILTPSKGLQRQPPLGTPLVDPNENFIKNKMFVFL